MSERHYRDGRRRRSTLRTIALGALLMVTASGGGAWLGTARRHATTALVVSAVDGDTLVVDLRGRRDTIRLLGVDTPETHHPTKPVECFGPEAAAYTAARLTGRSVRIETDVVRRDQYGRLLAYVTIDGRRFNDELLANGYARLLVIPPNGRHGRTMLTAELDARAAGRGLWGAC